MSLIRAEGWSCSPNPRAVFTRRINFEGATEAKPIGASLSGGAHRDMIGGCHEKTREHGASAGLDQGGCGVARQVERTQPLGKAIAPSRENGWAQ